eukprot:scaffold25274_cov53-Phaeocystis_antarctica.AAC.4
MLLAHLEDPLGHVLLGHAALDVEGCPRRLRVDDVLLCRLHPVARVGVLAAEGEPVVMVVPSLAQNGRDLGAAEASGEDRRGAPLVRVRGARGVCIHSRSHGLHEEFPIIFTVAAPRFSARHCSGLELQGARATVGPPAKDAGLRRRRVLPPSHGFPLLALAVALCTRTITGVDADLSVSPGCAILLAPLGTNGRIVAYTRPQRLLRRRRWSVDSHHRAVALVLAELRVGVISTVFVAPLVVHDVGDLCYCDADARAALPSRLHRMAAYEHRGQHD